MFWAVKRVITHWCPPTHPSFTAIRTLVEAADSGLVRPLEGQQCANRRSVAACQAFVPQLVFATSVNKKMSLMWRIPAIEIRGAVVASSGVLHIEEQWTASTEDAFARQDTVVPMMAAATNPKRGSRHMWFL